MKALRFFFAGVLGLGVAFALAAPGCSTGAVGVDACRAIESSRCDAAPACEDGDPSFGIVTEEQIENCKVFYNDACLVGLENVDEEPTQDTVDDCVAAVVKVGACQTAKAATMAECEDGPEVVAGAEELNPCEVLAKPENLKDCAFVAADDEEE